MDNCDIRVSTFYSFQKNPQWTPPLPLLPLLPLLSSFDGFLGTRPLISFHLCISLSRSIFFVWHIKLMEQVVKLYGVPIIMLSKLYNWIVKMRVVYDANSLKITEIIVNEIIFPVKMLIIWLGPSLKMA